MSDDGFTNRLQSIVDECGGQNALARKAGLSQGGIARLVSGGQPTLATLKAIANATGKSLLWLATGAVEEDQQPLPVKLSVEMVFVPVLDVHASAGNGAVVEAEPQTGVMALRRDMLRSLGISSTGSLKILEARGNSMEPLIRAGDLLLVDTSIDRVEDEGVYVFRRGSTVIVKRLRLTVMGGVELVSDNGNIAESISPEDLPDLHAAGRVVRVIRAI